MSTVDAVKEKFCTLTVVVVTASATDGSTIRRTATAPRRRYDSFLEERRQLMALKIEQWFEVL